MKRFACIGGVLFAAFLVAFASRPDARDKRLKGAVREERGGWIYLHLQGRPAEIGFQHGYLLANEIQDAQRVVAVLLERDTKRGWKFFHDAVRTEFWPRVDAEYQAEIQGISDGLRVRGVNLDAFDLTVLNAWQEIAPYWLDWYAKQHALASIPHAPVPEHCSAFVATGSYTAGGRPVIAHNAWTGYMEGSRWNIIFDIVPEKGHKILMDGFPGLIHSGDDFGINSAGLIITETTISQFHSYAPGIPEFVRARKAMQYAASIDDFSRIMRLGNTGGYANNWLVADRNTNEIASLELGVKYTPLRRTKDGYFVGANFPVDENLTREETDFDVHDLSKGNNSRRVRWEQLMAENKGKIDLASAKRFVSDHYDTYDRKEQPSERTLCGHIDLSPRGMKPWMQEYAPGGAVQAKATDAEMAGRMTLVAAMGHSCGIDFKAAQHLKEHPEFEWQKPLLRDLDAHPWTEFRAR